jgi:uncharacterized membrane protein YphA (DoxX/SURF4 family)
MKMTVTIARFLLGSMFAIFGLNGFLNFIAVPPPTGIGGQYMGALFVSHYLAVVFALELAAGVLLLVNRFVPLALTILAPILVNIALFHVFMAPQGFAPALIAITLWAAVFHRDRAAFSGLFTAKTDIRHAHRTQSLEHRHSAIHATAQAVEQSTASH